MTPEPSAARYLVSARAYRPQTFADLVAQEHVAETLRNAIASGRLAHAYLFSGPRGVGKTTAARLLAKAVNCLTPLAERPGAEPCRTCASCVAFEEGRSMNIFEIDAASNNGVDFMRDLRETTRTPPQGAKKKIYVLDEVHMFSSSAFNAMLKVLEEPPPYVLFIFATTEPHKVLPTILSRTQRFDFRRISVPEIVHQLRQICDAEGVEADDDALVLVAQRGDGAMRDALSIFDQARALTAGALTGDALREAFGVVPVDRYFEATDRAAAGDRAGVLGLVDGLVRRGQDLTEFVHGLAGHVRNLLAARATGSGGLIEGTDAVRARYVEAAGTWAEADLLHLLLVADETATALRDARQPRLTLELGLLRMASLERAVDLDRLLAHLERVERQLAAGGPPAAALPAAAPPAAPRPTATSEPAPTYAPPAAPASAARPEPRADEPRRPESPPPETPRAEPPRAEPPRAEPTRPEAARPEPRAERPSGPPPGDGGEPVPTRPPAPPAPPPAAERPDARPAPEPPAERPAAPALPFGRPALRRPGGPSSASGDGHVGPPPSGPAAPAEAVDADFGPSVGRVREAWPRVVGALRERSAVRLAAVLAAARPERVVRGAVEVVLADAFAVTVAEGQAAAVEAALADVLGADAPPLRFVLGAPGAREPAAAADPFERLKQLRQEHPVVRALFERFGAEVVYR